MLTHNVNTQRKHTILIHNVNTQCEHTIWSYLNVIRSTDIQLVTGIHRPSLSRTPKIPIISLIRTPRYWQTSQSAWVWITLSNWNGRSNSDLSPTPPTIQPGVSAIPKDSFANQRELRAWIGVCLHPISDQHCCCTDQVRWSLTRLPGL